MSRPQSHVVTLAFAVAFLALTTGCTSLTEPNAITVTKEKEEPSAAGQLAPGGGAAKPGPGGAQAPAPQGPQGGPQAGAQPPSRPMPAPPAPAKGGSCGE